MKVLAGTEVRRSNETLTIAARRIREIGPLVQHGDGPGAPEAPPARRGFPPNYFVITHSSRSCRSASLSLPGASGGIGSLP